MRAPGVSPWRHGLEVSVTALFAVAIVVASWFAAA
jgi:hypothetical protein